MAQVTYRGVTYDTAQRPNQATQAPAHVEIYRGIKFYVNEEGYKVPMIAGGK